MVNYQLSNLRKYHGETLCGSNGYLCHKKKGKKENLNLRSVTMIDPVTGWFKIIQYDDKRAIVIINIVKTTWLTIHLRPTEIMYDQGPEFIGREFRKSLIEKEYGIISKTSTLGNPTSNAMLERIHKVLGNLVPTFNIKDTYDDED